MTAITDQQRDNVDFSLLSRNNHPLCEQAFDRSTWCLGVTRAARVNHVQDFAESLLETG